MFSPLGSMSVTSTGRTAQKLSKPFARAQIARRDVVQARVAQDMLARALGSDVTTALLDHDGELGLVVHPLHLRRKDDGIIGPGERGERLQEDDRLGGDGEVLLLGVIAVVE